MKSSGSALQYKNPFLSFLGVEMSEIDKAVVKIPVDMHVEVEVEGVEDDIVKIGEKAIEEAISKDSSTMLEKIGSSLNHTDPRKVDVEEIHHKDGSVEFPD